jgi:hypothetical protein
MLHQVGRGFVATAIHPVARKQSGTFAGQLHGFLRRSQSIPNKRNRPCRHTVFQSAVFIPAHLDMWASFDGIRVINTKSGHLGQAATCALQDTPDQSEFGKGAACSLGLLCQTLSHGRDDLVWQRVTLLAIIFGGLALDLEFCEGILGSRFQVKADDRRRDDRLDRIQLPAN